MIDMQWLLGEHIERRAGNALLAQRRDQCGSLTIARR